VFYIYTKYTTKIIIPILWITYFQRLVYW